MNKVNLFENQFLEQNNFPLYEGKPKKILIIASTGRSGSHMLGHALWKTGCFGFPLEYLNPGEFSRWADLTGKNTIEDILIELQKIRTSPNGVFAIKIHYAQIEQSIKSFKKLQSLFPNAYYVMLTRNCVLSQAVSLSKAKQTRTWLTDKAEEHQNLRYSFKEINRNIKFFLRQNSSWHYTLNIHKCKYMHITYEELELNLNQVISKIAKYVEVNIPVTNLECEKITHKQRDSINEEWKNKFLTEVLHSKKNLVFDSWLEKIIYKSNVFMKKLINKTGLIKLIKYLMN